MKILDFDLEGSHFIIEADISPRQEADDDMECQWLRYDFDNTQVYKETDGVVSPFQITAVAWANLRPAFTSRSYLSLYCGSFLSGIFSPNSILRNPLVFISVNFNRLLSFSVRCLY